MSAPTVTKFVRQARAICALDQVELSAPLPAAPALILCMALQAGRVSIRPWDDGSDGMRSRRAADGAECSLLSCDAEAAVGVLRVQRGRIVLSGSRMPEDDPAGSWVLAQFWHVLCSALATRRRIPPDSLHLHLAELTFRWNHRPCNLHELLEQRMRSTAHAQVKSILVRKR